MSTAKPVYYRRRTTTGYRKPAASAAKPRYTVKPRYYPRKTVYASVAPSAPRTYPRKRVVRQSNAVGGALGSAAGMAIGGPAGAALGNVLGQGAQSLFRYITGYGDYKIQSNSLVGSGSSMDSLPKFMSEGRGQRVLHREFIQNVITSATAGAFKVDKVPIQPAYSFPWLSTVAQQYQEYKINGLVFEFKSTSSDALNSTNTALGDVVLATQYDCTRPDFVNETQMYQTEFVSSCKPSQSIMHPIECARGESLVSVLNTRNGNFASVATADIRLYDFANFYISTFGNQGTSVVVGQLWVTYDITLLKPQLGSTTDVADHYRSIGGTAPNYVDQYFGNPTPSPSSSSDMGTTLLWNGTVNATHNNQISFPSSFVGNVLIMYTVWGSGIPSGGITAPVATPSGGATANNMFLNSSSVATNSRGSDGISDGILWAEYAFKITNGGIVTFSGGVGPSGYVNSELFIFATPVSLTN